MAYSLLIIGKDARLMDANQKILTNRLENSDVKSHMVNPQGNRLVDDDILRSALKDGVLFHQASNTIAPEIINRIRGLHNPEEMPDNLQNIVIEIMEYLTGRDAAID